MSVIAVSGVPLKWGLGPLDAQLKKLIKGPYEPLNFQNKKHVKICYIRLSDRLDPVQVVESINNRKTHLNKHLANIKAYIPDNVPDLPLAKSAKFKKVCQRHAGKGKILGVPDSNLKYYEIVLWVHGEILTEMQSKYPQLYHLSSQTNHKLLNEISKIVFDRLKAIVESHEAEATENCWKMSMFYRRMHPHFGDFQLILSTLHRLQDASGAPRKQISEQEMAKFEPKPYVVGDVPYNQVTKFCSAYTTRVLRAITAHVQAWDADLQAPGGEDLARSEVRQEIRNLMPYMPLIMTQLISKHFKPEETPYQRVRIYGEPFLPNKVLMLPFISKYSGGSRAVRADRMFNLMKFKVTQKNFEALLAMDGTTLHGSKLVIRNDMPVYHADDASRAAMAAALGAPPDAHTARPRDTDYDEGEGEGDEGEGGEGDEMAVEGY